MNKLNRLLNIRWVTTSDGILPTTQIYNSACIIEESYN